MRPKSKVSDWLAKKSEDGSDDGEQSSDGGRSEEDKSASEQEEDGDTEDEDDREFDIELIERKVLRSRPTDRIQYMKNELYGRVSCKLLSIHGSLPHLTFLSNAFSLVLIRFTTSRLRPLGSTPAARRRKNTRSGRRRSASSAQVIGHASDGRPGSMGF